MWLEISIFWSGHQTCNLPNCSQKCLIMLRAIKHKCLQKLLRWHTREQQIPVCVYWVGGANLDSEKV